jgi:hypothetical protein
MDDTFHLHLQLPNTCGKEEALLSRCRPTLYMFELTEERCVYYIRQRGSRRRRRWSKHQIFARRSRAAGRLHYPKRRASSTFHNWASRLRAMAPFLNRVLGQCRVGCSPKEFLTPTLVPTWPEKYMMSLLFEIKFNIHFVFRPIQIPTLPTYFAYIFPNMFNPKSA